MVKSTHSSDMISNELKVRYLNGVNNSRTSGTSGGGGGDHKRNRSPFPNAKGASKNQTNYQYN